jgi:hypothetical protein
MDFHGDTIAYSGRKLMMPRGPASRSTVLARILFAGAALAISVQPAAAMRTIDFRTPRLGGEPKRIVNPFVAEGVTFTALAPTDLRYTDQVVGLVKNSETSVCVGAPDTAQRLGTGRAAMIGGGIGGAGFAIQATFSKEAGPVTKVSVEFQTLAGLVVDLHLFEAGGVEVGSAQAVALPPDSSCGRPGKPRARVAVTATSTAPVAYAIMEVPPRGQWVFVIDRFRFGRAGEAPATTGKP